MYYDKLYRDTRYEKINRSVMIRTPLDSDIIFIANGGQTTVKHIAQKYLFPIYEVGNSVRKPFLS